MKKYAYLLAFLATGFFFTTQASAQSVGIFDIQASVPSATSITYNAQIVEVINNVITPVSTVTNNQLDFDSANGGSLVFDSTNNIWTAPQFFVIDFAGQTSAGDPAPVSYQNVSFTFAETANPNQVAGRTGVAGHGIGEKVVATVLQWNFTDPSKIQQVSQTALNSIPSFNDAAVDEGFPRVILALSDGTPLAGTSPFTSGDAPGAYTGTLTITSTLN